LHLLQADSPYPENEILTAVANGDESAFSRLVDHFWKNVYLHALTYTRSPQQAEEVTQDIFLLVWNQRQQLTTIKEFPAWLHIVARNKIISAMRKRLLQLSQWNEAEQNSPDLLEKVLVPDKQTEFREAYQLLLEGIERLPEKRREVFTMSRIQGKTNAEIAEILQIHPVTVSQYLAKALTFLRSYLREGHLDSITIILLLAGAGA
jgi:RNA polymerase sigma-70 factor (family 1)